MKLIHSSVSHAGCRRRALGLAVWLGTAWCVALQAESVVGSVHDLSANSKRGPNNNSKRNVAADNARPVKAEGEKSVCIFCHTPHGMGASSGALWNRYDPSITYTPYRSTTAKARPGQPTGASRLCLSCHDGTVAMGMLRNRKHEVRFTKGVRKMPTGRANLGTDLSDDHPISFVFDKALADANGELRDPATLPRNVHLDKNGELQCTTCHDPHNNQYGKFLVMDNAGAALCVVCHDQPYWFGTSHHSSSKRWDGLSTDPWPHTPGTTVAANGCENCHSPHAAGTKQRLLNFAREEDNCYSCHNGHVASKDLQREFGKASVHPVALSMGLHDPYAEYKVDPLNSPRHVECVDCHNPHATKSVTAQAPTASGALTGVIGINAAGQPVTPLTKQYELCFRCHADSLNRGPARVSRQFAQTNTRLEFAARNASFHPVVVAGKNDAVPSLVAPLNTASLLYCTACHNNDQGPGANGNGPSGPHGSAYTPLLERQLILSDFSAEGPDVYALCYKCHNRQSILNDESFKLHKKHIVDVQTACTTCHDPHGVESVPHLINFNTRYVKASPTNLKLEYVSQGKFMGTCSLTCHGKDHVALSDQTNTAMAAPGITTTGKRSLKR
jgi:predicted CXXCH cytochrome family protein